MTQDSSDDLTGDPPGHSGLNRRRVLGGIAGAAVTGGFGAPTVAAAGDDEDDRIGTLQTASPLTAEQAQSEIGVAFNSTQTAQLHQQLIEKGFSLQRDSTSAYALESGLSSVYAGNPVAVMIPYRKDDTGLFEPPGMAFITSVTVDDPDRDRTVATTVGFDALEEESFFSMFSQASSAKVTMHQPEPATQSVKSSATTTSLDRSLTQDGGGILCAICEALSGVLCTFLDDFDQGGCIDACQSQPEICNQLCTLLVDFLNETACGSPQQICGLIGVCEPPSGPGGPDDPDNPIDPDEPAPVPPEEPESPEEPDQPEEPESPDEPDQPEEPDDPDDGDDGSDGDSGGDGGDGSLLFG